MDITIKKDLLNMSTKSLTELHEAISAELQDRTVRTPIIWKEIDEEEYQQLELITSRKRTGA